MNFLLSGADGFIGKNLLNELLKQKGSVNCIVRNFPKKKEIKNVKYILHNISLDNASLFRDLPQIDTLIHLAWSKLDDYSDKRHLDEELKISFQFINEAIEHGIKNILVAGTCFEYGNIEGEVKEDFSPKPINNYSLAKDKLRKKIEFLKIKKDFNLTWMRIFYIYGENQSRNSIFEQLKNAAKKKEKFFDMSEGNQERDYSHVSEIVSKIAKLSYLNNDNGIVNLCSGVPTKIRNLVQQWINEHGWTIKPNYGYYKYNKDEPMAFWGSNKKYNKLIQK